MSNILLVPSGAAFLLSEHFGEVSPICLATEQGCDLRPFIPLSLCLFPSVTRVSYFMASLKKAIKAMAVICIIGGAGRGGSESSDILAKPYIWLPVPGQIKSTKGKCKQHFQIQLLQKSEETQSPAPAPDPSPVSPRRVQEGEEEGDTFTFCIVPGCHLAGGLFCLCFYPCS